MFCYYHKSIQDTIDRWEDAKTSLSELKQSLESRMLSSARCEEMKMVVEESIQELDELLTEQTPLACFDVEVLQRSLSGPDATHDVLMQGIHSF